MAKWSGVRLGLASGEGVGIEAGGEMFPLDAVGVLVILVAGEVVEAVEAAEKAVAQG